MKMTRQKTEELELAFDTRCRQFGLPFCQKLHITIEGTKSWFEIDRWFPDYGVGVEINEELFHKQWAAQTRDAKKHNYCVIKAIPLLVFTGSMLTNNPGACMAQVEDLLRQKGWTP
jgi:hypothetical protein